MHTVYASGQYNFLYAALVYNVNTYAAARLDEYNIAWVPSCYFDGGYAYNAGMSTAAVAAGLDSCGLREVPALELSVTLTWVETAFLQIDVSITNNDLTNTAPSTPSAPVGPALGAATKPYLFSAAATDPDNDPLYYQFDWGDGTESDWVGPYPSGSAGSADHAWTTGGSFVIRTKAKDPYGAETDWSASAAIDLKPAGDANDDGIVNIGDAVYIITYVFRGGPAPAVLDSADGNCDGKVNVGDAVFLVTYIFRSGPPPGCL
ncbi:MAG: PKD domain-containing protein [candidate division Zixibacteria bacterium]|nr:PKD domain-containing protein [candidate division Zixibacteria bacterium]